MTGETKTGPERPADRIPLTRRLRVSIFVLAIICGALALVVWSRLKSGPQFIQAQWQQEADGSYAIKDGPETFFNFFALSNRVLVPDAPVFHFNTNQDFSVEAWIKAYPMTSPLARKAGALLLKYPALGRFVPNRFSSWVSTHSVDNDYGVSPVVDKHQTPSPSQSIGFELYLDYGRLACQLSAAPMRQLSFQNFVSPGPNLQDRHWHHVAMTVERTSTNGGKLYVDGHVVLTFDPTRQAGDLANSEPVRIGNHANPNLRCFYKGVIGRVFLYRRALHADEIARHRRQG